MKTLLLYFILTQQHTWQFLAVEHVTTREYCEYLANTVDRVYRGTPGNVRIVCADDQGSEA
jgi:hypothetical protein